MIEVRNLVKYYGSHMAVDHLNFTIQKGQIYGFLGPNGAGKSTTMNIMTGYLGATEGQVLINGHDILTEPYKAKRDIGYLPEQPPLYVDMTVLEYLKFVATLKLIDKSIKSAQLDQVISLVRLGPVKNRLIKNLSKGYRQRVGLAGALIGFPEIIILDEPTASCIYTQKGNKKIRKPQAANQTALIFDRRAAARLLSINSIRRLCWS